MAQFIETGRESTVTPTPAQVFLQPIAPPSILGLFGFAVATMMVSSYMAGWWGNGNSPLFLFPFVAFFGGLAQFISALWAFRARDGLAVAMHGIWGSFWMAYGLFYGMVAAKWVVVPPAGTPFSELAMWFVGLAWVTWMGVWAASAYSFAFMGFLLLLAAGATVAAIGLFSGSTGLIAVAGWLLCISSIIAWYTASAMMLESVFGRSILPIGKAEHAEQEPKVAIGIGEPGVMHGQA